MSVNLTFFCGAAREIQYFYRGMFQKGRSRKRQTQLEFRINPGNFDIGDHEGGSIGTLMGTKYHFGGRNVPLNVLQKKNPASTFLVQYSTCCNGGSGS